MEILIPEKKESECDCVVIKRGDIFYADLRPVVGSEPGGVGPVLLIQNDVGNRHSPTAVSYTHLIAHETIRMYWCRGWRDYGMKGWLWSQRQEIRDQSRGA